MQPLNSISTSFPHTSSMTDTTPLLNTSLSLSLFFFSFFLSLPNFWSHKNYLYNYVTNYKSPPLGICKAIDGWENPPAKKKETIDKSIFQTHQTLIYIYIYILNNLHHSC
ncbi:hypothetical protein ACOSP7_018250 [Xanthoceras sorbifolium]